MTDRLSSLTVKGSQRVYRGPLEKRLHLVDFVTKGLLYWPHIKSHSLKFERRINWKKLAQAWNKKYPHDSKTPNRLNSEYHRILKRARDGDDPVLEQFFSRKEQLVVAWVTSLDSVSKSSTAVQLSIPGEAVSFP